MGKSQHFNEDRICEPVYGDNDKYIKAKVKSYGDKVNTDFRGKKIPKENASYFVIGSARFCYQSK